MAGLGRQVIILTTTNASLDFDDDGKEERQTQLEAAGVDVIAVPGVTARHGETKEGRGGVNIRAALQLLSAHGISAVMVEGGSEIIASFLLAKEVDQIVLTIAPRFIGGGLHSLTAPVRSGGLSLEESRSFQLGADTIVHGSFRRRNYTTARL
jgi:riboflavin biosynthesis pyrimidine reductase